MRRILYLFTGLAFLGLAACGGGGGGSGIDPRLARLDGYAAQKVRVLGDPEAGVPSMAQTAPAAVPTTGSTQFTGAGSILIALPDRTLALYGDASLSVDFGQGTAQGQIAQVFGQTASGAIADYAGTVALIGEVAEASLLLDYFGSLTGPNSAFGLEGQLEAALLGQAADALAGGDIEAQIDDGGVTRDGVVLVYAEAVEVSP